MADRPGRGGGRRKKEARMGEGAGRGRRWVRCGNDGCGNEGGPAAKVQHRARPPNRHVEMGTSMCFTEVSSHC
jgi:hypothetical protein